MCVVLVLLSFFRFTFHANVLMSISLGGLVRIVFFIMALHILVNISICFCNTMLICIGKGHPEKGQFVSKVLKYKTNENHFKMRI